MKLTLEKAYKYAILKWELIRDNDGDEPIKYPAVLTTFLFDCSYCDMFFINHVWTVR